MREKLYASDFLGKDVLNLETGDLIGTVSGILLIPGPWRMTAFAYQMTSSEGEKTAFCDYQVVTDLDQQAVVIAAEKSYLPIEDKQLLGLSCIDKAGKLVGKIVDCAWQSETGMLSELVVDASTGRQGIAVEMTEKIGSGAVVLSDIIENIETVQYHDIENESNDSNVEDIARTFIKRVGTTLSDAGQRVGERVKQIDTEELNREVNRFTERVGKELHKVIDNIAEQKKQAKYATMESEVISILRDLEGFTVSTPIYDNRELLIILPGQKIGEDVVKRVIGSNKVAELYRVAVSIKDGESNE